MSDQQIQRHLDAASLLVGNGFRDIAAGVLDKIMGDLRGDTAEEPDGGSAPADPNYVTPSVNGLCAVCDKPLHQANKSGTCYPCQKALRKSKPMPTTCLQCGQGLPKPLNRQRKYCSSLCQKRAARGHPAGAKFCVMCCGTLPIGRRKYCSRGCARRWKYLEQRDRNLAEGRPLTDYQPVGAYAKELNRVAKEDAHLEAELIAAGWEFSIEDDIWVKRNGHKEAVNV